MSWRVTEFRSLSSLQRVVHILAKIFLDSLDFRVVMPEFVKYGSTIVDTSIGFFEH